MDETSEDSNSTPMDLLDLNPDVFVDEMIDYLIKIKDVTFKNQHKDEVDLNEEQKKNIATEVFNNSKAVFLSRFGKFLLEEHLNYFRKCAENDAESYELNFYIENLRRFFSKTKRKTDIKNRRYSALNKLIVSDSAYFSETEMMRRNPLLYEQLVGQYMSAEEKKIRDNIDTQNITLLNVLLEGIDRDETKRKIDEQQKYEDSVMEEDEEDDTDIKNDRKTPSPDPTEYTFPQIDKKWGEFETPETSTLINQPRRFEIPKAPVLITAPERELLKNEFITVMYQNFIEGKDLDFDYSKIDDNDEYDNLDIKNCDLEEKYFDSEPPEEVEVDGNDKNDKNDKKHEEEDDELDLYMKKLEEQIAIRDLSQNMSNL